MSTERPAGTGGEARELLEEMRKRALAERASIIEAAREKAQEIEAACEVECSRLEQEAAKALDAELDRERQKRLGEARTAMRLRILEVKRKALDVAFEAAESRLSASAGGEDFHKALRRRIREGLRALGAGTRVEVDEADLAACRTLAEEEGLDCIVAGSDEAPGTVRLTSSDGGRAVDNSLMTRLRRCRRLAGAEIARILLSRAESGAGDGAHNRNGADG